MLWLHLISQLATTGHVYTHTVMPEQQYGCCHNYRKTAGRMEEEEKLTGGRTFIRIVSVLTWSGFGKAYLPLFDCTYLRSTAKKDEEREVTSEIPKPKATNSILKEIQPSPRSLFYCSVKWTPIKGTHFSTSASFEHIRCSSVCERTNLQSTLVLDTTIRGLYTDSHETKPELQVKLSGFFLWDT